MIDSLICLTEYSDEGFCNRNKLFRETDRWTLSMQSGHYPLGSKMTCPQRAPIRVESLQRQVTEAPSLLNERVHLQSDDIVINL